MRGSWSSGWILVLALGIGSSLSACGSGSDDSASPKAGDTAGTTAAADQAQLRKRGKVIYETYCTACHARDPIQDGPVGPANAGSPLALLEAKVLRNEYPAGYTPKRDTAAMVPLPHLEPDLPALHAYLNSFDE